MSALTNSIASRWSGVSVYWKAVLELALPFGVGGEGVALAPLALGVEVEQLAGELLRRAPGAGLDVSQRVPPSLESGGCAPPPPT